jgi:hypothetical protein
MSCLVHKFGTLQHLIPRIIACEQAKQAQATQRSAAESSIHESITGGGAESWQLLYPTHITSHPPPPLGSRNCPALIFSLPAFPIHCALPCIVSCGAACFPPAVAAPARSVGPYTGAANGVVKPAVDVVAGLAGGGEGSISTFLDTLRVDESCGSMKDVKSLVKTMTLGLKTVLWCILTLGKSNAAGGAGASAGGVDAPGMACGADNALTRVWWVRGKPASYGTQACGS